MVIIGMNLELLFVQDINNGLILVFGNSTATNSTKKITLPITYSNTIYTTIACIRKYADPSSDIQSVCVCPYSQSVLGAYMDYLQSVKTLPFSYLCIGY